MSAKRVQILVGFAALAVILVVAIVVVRPTFRSEEATGAIGAVQKHHAPQITKADVVLGGEQTKQQQKILFADYLADANELKSFSFGATQDRAQVQARMEAKSQEVNARFQNDFDSALAMAQKLANDEALSAGSRQQALGIIAILIGNRQSANRTEAASRFSDLASKLSAAAQVDMKSLDMASFASATRSLDAISRADLANGLRAHAEYLGMMAKESEVLATASRQTLGTSFNYGKIVYDMATQLQAAAQTNARFALQAETEEIAALGRMSVLASRADAANRTQAEALTRALDSRAVAIRTNLDAMSSVAGNRMYAAMIGDSDSFSMQLKTLQDQVMNLGSRQR